MFTTALCGAAFVRASVTCTASALILQTYLSLFSVVTPFFLIPFSVSFSGSSYSPLNVTVCFKPFCLPSCHLTYSHGIKYFNPDFSSLV